ncbi:alpha-N-acetyl-neuraminyl-2,3-beta-galactosyl-1,3-N-acetyl-galactosaminide alpha-2,6-sialyltransferase-like [Asterias amurensis]|uniref:alpha-N-acetyl-neuraminyl-2,3-beta-galactosyl-1, 3-N-acetyl-galactosaminide alpha-2,6-sialyltransferase-like n=1 Tax=Asterias amurensis TaxID=7602 RepID=UPI003AB439E8
MASSTKHAKMKAYVAIVGLYVVLSVVAMLCFDELSSWMPVVISVRNHCDSDDIRCKPSSNFQDLVINLTTPSVEGGSTTLRPVEARRKARLAEWIGPQGYRTYKSNKTPRQCNSCSIVNSAGRLLGSKVGHVIDKADCVIRMNTAPTHKYEADVGSRTTFRVIGHRNLPSMLKKVKDRSKYLDNVATRSDLVIVWHYGWKITKEALNKYCKKNCLTRPHAAVYISGEEVMKRNEVMFYKELNITIPSGSFWMSTGWGTMLFALDMCQSIQVYGMIYENFCSENLNDTQPYHYYDKVKRECAYYSKSEADLRRGHKYFTEKAVFAKWANMYDITFHEPSWTGHLEGYSKDTVIDSLFHRTFRENELRKKMLESKTSSNQTEDTSSTKTQS